MPSDPVRGKARPKFPEPSYEEQREAMIKAGGGKVIVERVVSGNDTFGGRAPPHRPAPLTAHQIAVLLDEEHQRHNVRVEQIITMLRRTGAIPMTYHEQHRAHWLIMLLDSEGESFVMEGSLQQSYEACLAMMMGVQLDSKRGLWTIDKVVRMEVGGPVTDVSKQIASDWLASLYDNGDKGKPLPAFIDAHLPDADWHFECWRDAPDVSIADENRPTKASLGLVR